MMIQLDIKQYVHSFMIGDMSVKLLISRLSGLWECKLIEGETGIGLMSGGVHKTLEEYIRYCERQHRYSHQFFKIKKCQN